MQLGQISHYSSAKEKQYLYSRVWGPEVSHISRQSVNEGGKIVSPTHRSPLPLYNIPGTHFFKRLSRLQSGRKDWVNRESKPRLTAPYRAPSPLLRITEETTACSCKKMEGVHSFKMAVHFFQNARSFPRIRPDITAIHGRVLGLQNIMKTARNLKRVEVFTTTEEKKKCLLRFGPGYLCRYSDCVTGSTVRGLNPVGNDFSSTRRDRS